jgi:phenylacetate-CoA ligase
MVRRAAVERCPCGSYELALEGGILARSDEMVVVRGVNLYPSAVEEVVRSCGVAEFRVETYTERALKEMSVEVEPAEPGDAATLCHRVTHALQSAFGLRVSVSCVAPGTLPRFEAKARRWVQR